MIDALILGGIVLALMVAAGYEKADAISKLNE